MAKEKIKEPEEKKGLPEFDLDIPQSKEDYAKKDIDINQELYEIKEKLKYHDKQDDMIWQAIRQQGLKSGIPNLIISEMAEVISILNSGGGVLENSKTIENELLEDEHIRKVRDSGGYESIITAESMRHSQVSRYREDRHSIKSFILSATEMFKRLQKKVQE